MTHIVTAEIDGVPFAEADFGAASEVLGLMMVLFLGGVESTAGLIGTLFKLLAENPDQRAILRANPALIPDAVEEAIRLATPLQLVGRTTSREVTLHGVTIPAGGRVVLVYGAANRDERRFGDPDRFDVTRGRFRHLGFGEGMHGCLGAPLARLEAKVALEEGLPALGDYAIAAPPERYRTTPNMYVWDHLHLAFPVAAAPEHHAHMETVWRDSTSMTVLTREFEADARVEGKAEVADGVVALTLRQIADSPLPRWSPGAHVDLILDGAPTRQYSLCGDPADHHLWRLGILRDAEGGGGSRYVHDRLPPGDTVRVRGPRNNFALAASPRYLFIAGGIGITPILPMIAAAQAAGADWSLLYGGRRRASMAFLGELARYGSRVTVAPQDETGLLDLDSLLGTPQPGTLVYCCGPEPLLTAVEIALRGLAGQVTARGAVRGPAADRAGPRRGVRGRTGGQRAHPDRARRTGPSSTSSRRPGWGSCPRAPRAPAARARPPCSGGVPDHRDSVLTGEERGRERLHDDLRIPVLHRAPGPGPVGPSRQTGDGYLLSHARDTSGTVVPWMGRIRSSWATGDGWLSPPS